MKAQGFGKLNVIFKTVTEINIKDLYFAGYEKSTTCLKL